MEYAYKTWNCKSVCKTCVALTATWNRKPGACLASQSWRCRCCSLVSSSGGLCLDPSWRYLKYFLLMPHGLLGLQAFSWLHLECRPSTDKVKKDRQSCGCTGLCSQENMVSLHHAQALGSKASGMVQIETMESCPGIAAPRYHLWICGSLLLDLAATADGRAQPLVWSFPRASSRGKLLVWQKDTLPQSTGRHGAIGSWMCWLPSGRDCQTYQSYG